MHFPQVGYACFPHPVPSLSLSPPHILRTPVKKNKIIFYYRPAPWRKHAIWSEYKCSTICAWGLIAAKHPIGGAQLQGSAPSSHLPTRGGGGGRCRKRAALRGGGGYKECMQHIWYCVLKRGGGRGI
uniref:Uncharacterized protein n=1 Tax=Morchella brunnea TaxID=1174671 RepID=A0A8K1I7S3_9PEZI|nr:hypothetical protein LK370_mgp065 [Morchella brunnea]UBU98451.1 hypothetical protein [Morchella brunnea]